MKGVAMSTGRQLLKEIYVGFLLLLLSFLYLSHLSSEARISQTDKNPVRGPVNAVEVHKS